MVRHIIVSTLCLGLAGAALAGGGGAVPPKGDDGLPTTTDTGRPLTRSERDAQRAGGVTPVEPKPPSGETTTPEPTPVTEVQPTPVTPVEPTPVTEAEPAPAPLLPGATEGLARLRGRLELVDGRLSLMELRARPPFRAAQRHPLKLVGEDLAAVHSALHGRMGLVPEVEVSGRFEEPVHRTFTLAKVATLDGKASISHTSVEGGAVEGKVTNTRGLRVANLLVRDATPDLSQTLQGNLDQEVVVDGWLLRMNGGDPSAIIPTRVQTEAEQQAILPAPVVTEVAPVVSTSPTPLLDGQRRQGGMGGNLETALIPTEVVTPAPTEVVTPAPTEVVTPNQTEVIPAPTEVIPEPTEVVTPNQTEVIPAPTEVIPEPTEVVTPAPTEVEPEPAPQQATPRKLKFESGYLYDLVQQLDRELPAEEKAKGHAITVPMVMLANGLRPGSQVAPRPGRELTIPAPATPETLVVRAPGGKMQHWVQDGDRIATIARRYKVPPQKLLELNPTIADRVAKRGAAGLRSNDLLLLPDDADLTGVRDVTPSGAR